MYIKKNLDDVVNDIIISCEKVNKNADDVKLIAVTKTVGIDKIKEVISLGVTDIGENKVQEILNKYEFVKDDVNIHLIGTLQTNKVKYIIDKVSMIHSLDRIELAGEINKRAGMIKKVMSCLVQVNISKEDTKHGIYEEDVLDFVKKVSLEFKNIKINGFMTMAPYEESAENVRIYFRKLKNLSDNIISLNLNNVDIKYLSMGMSNDFKIAIEEGSNMVRVGSYIFGERKY